MPQPANILHDEPTATQTPIGSSSSPPPIPCDAAGSAGKFRYTSDAWALDRLLAVKRDRGRTLRGSPVRALALYVELRRRADRAGHVRTNNDQLARAIGVRDRNTVCSAAHLLVDAGLLELPARTYDRRGYVNGLAYVLRVDAAYAVIARQEDLPFKSSTKKSSAVPAPARPLTPATMKFTQRATWEVTNEHLAAKERGEDVPDNLPDVSQAIGDWLTDHGATAAEADIRAALEHVDRQRRRQQPLPLMGLARRQAAARTTIGAVDTASDEARERCRVAAVEARDRRRVIEEQIRTEIAAAVAAQPAAAAVLRALVRPELDAVLRRCPGLTDRDRPVHEHHAIVERVLSSLRGQSVPDTIAALVARGA